MKKVFGIIAMVAITATTMFLNNNIAEAKIDPKPEGEWFSWGEPEMYLAGTITHYIEGYGHVEEPHWSWDCKGWSGSC